jgi:hypothetical protein
VRRATYAASARQSVLLSVDCRQIDGEHGGATGALVGAALSEFRADPTGESTDDDRPPGDDSDAA